MPQLLKPMHLEPMLHNKRNHRNEKHTHHNEKRTVTVSSSLSESIVPSHRLVALFVSTLSLTIKATTSCTSCSLIDMSLNIPMLPVANKDDLLWNHLPSSEDIVQVSSDLDSKLSAREYV
ncbi:hypothetical protein J1605_011068 [Eschrichtius robustus]|uniref:Uncharacterized protein n=1 Tax=Eschrichtius robustus TaxID=9764 RepID=A0AB34GPL2_ESCRO|nr:hypothetical protein J1605_011068 [Eschrichtius robustus]